MTTQTICSKWSLGTWLQPTAAPELSVPQTDHSQAPPVLQLPPDILLSVCDHLDTPTTLSLSLTCRSLFAVCFTTGNRNINPLEKRQLLLLLEKDTIAAGNYYCFSCNKLHPFESTWGPHQQSKQYKSRPCNTRDRFSPTGNPYDLSFAHARLVMNKHFYGPEHGISIDNICITHQERREAATVRCSTDAKIIDDELCVRRKYSLTLTNEQVHKFRKCAGSRDFKICEHTALFSTTQYRQQIPELLRSAYGGVETMVPCDNAPGSCGLCLMDYDVTIIPAAIDRSVWHITVNAYHQLGQCRSPDDWKWARFTEMSRSHLFFPNRPNRRGSAYNIGQVSQLWADHATTPTSRTDSLLLPHVLSTWKWGKFLSLSSH